MTWANSTDPRLQAEAHSWSTPTQSSPSGPWADPSAQGGGDAGEWTQTTPTHTTSTGNLHPPCAPLLQTLVLLLRQNYHLCELDRGHLVQNIWKLRVVLGPPRWTTHSGDHMLALQGCRVEEMEGRRSQTTAALSVQLSIGAPGVKSVWAAPRGHACPRQQWLEAPKVKPVWEQGDKCSPSLPSLLIPLRA